MQTPHREHLHVMCDRGLVGSHHVEAAPGVVATFRKANSNFGKHICPCTIILNLIQSWRGDSAIVRGRRADESCRGSRRVGTMDSVKTMEDFLSHQ